jgi:hypothetical protein
MARITVSSLQRTRRTEYPRLLRSCRELDAELVVRSRVRSFVQGGRDVGVTYDPALIPQLNHNEHISQDIDMVAAGIDYRFGGPVIAKY